MYNFSTYEVWLQNRNEESRTRYKEKKKLAKKAVRKAKEKADDRWADNVSKQFWDNKKQ